MDNLGISLAQQIALLSEAAPTGPRHLTALRFSPAHDTDHQTLTPRTWHLRGRTKTQTKHSMIPLPGTTTSKSGQSRFDCTLYPID